MPPDGSSTSVYLSDVWRLDFLSLSWSFVKGSVGGWNGSYYDSSVIAAAAGVYHINNEPRGRAQASSAIGANGVMWMYGGGDLNGTYGLSDLWAFNTNSNFWVCSLLLQTDGCASTCCI